MDNKTSLKKQDRFILLNKNLLGLGATYSSVLVFNEKNNVLHSCSTDPDWSDEFTSKKLYKDCHLLQEAYKQMGYNNSSFTLAWDFYLPITEEARALEDIRKQKNITHGVGFCIKGLNQTKILLNVAGKYSDVNFGLNVLRNRDQIYKELRSFMLK